MPIIWPQYFDKNLSLKEGRKVSMEYALAEPSISEIERALKRLGLTYTTEKDKAYPGKWYEKSGRIVVEWEGTKPELLKEISLKIKEIRN